MIACVHAMHTVVDSGAPLAARVRRAPLGTWRALHAGTEIGGEIDPAQYRAVAAAIRFADAMRRKAWRFG